MLYNLARWIIAREYRNNPTRREAHLLSIAAILKSGGLGNNNAKRREVAEQVLRFTTEPTIANLKTPALVEKAEVTD